MVASSHAVPARSPRDRTLGCVLQPRRAWRQGGVRGGLRVQLFTGSQHQARTNLAAGTVLMVAQVSSDAGRAAPGEQLFWTPPRLGAGPWLRVLFPHTGMV